MAKRYVIHCTEDFNQDVYDRHQKMTHNLVKFTHMFIGELKEENTEVTSDGTERGIVAAKTIRAMLFPEGKQ